MNYRKSKHGVADILLGPQRPCARSDLINGQCVCNGSSYFPTYADRPPNCGRDENANKLYVTHPVGTKVSVMEDCSGSGRFGCLEGNYCFCNGDCPPGKVCSKLTNTCVDPCDLRPGLYDVTDYGMMYDIQADRVPNTILMHEEFLKNYLHK